MNSRTGQAGRDSSFNSLLKVLYPVQSRSEPIRPEVETGSLQNQSLDWAPALISLSSFANPVTDTLFTSSCVFTSSRPTNKPGGIWLSPTSRLGTGGFLNPCVWPSISPALVSR